MYVYVHCTCMLVHVYKYMYTSTCIHVWVYKYMYVSVCTCIKVHVHLYKYVNCRFIAPSLIKFGWNTRLSIWIFLDLELQTCNKVHVCMYMHFSTCTNKLIKHKQKWSNIDFFHQKIPHYRIQHDQYPCRTCLWVGRSMQYCGRYLLTPGEHWHCPIQSLAWGGWWGSVHDPDRTVPWHYYPRHKLHSLQEIWNHI